MIEELIPTPQELIAVDENDAADLLYFAWSVTPGISQSDWRQPELRSALARPDMDVWWLVRLAVLVRVEVEPVRPEAVNDWHGSAQ
jgi:hypothetical protein